MKKTFYFKNEKPKSPLMISIVLYLLADKFQLEWLWGICWFLIATVWIDYVIKKGSSEEVDLFDTKEDNYPKSASEAKKTFAERMAEKMQEVNKL